MTLFPHHLYHGTSAHLLPFIEKHGLGGRSLLAEWRVMEFLRLAFPTLRYDPLHFEDPDYNIKGAIRKAVEGGEGGMNFEYGDLYVAGGYERAASYASYAPELIDLVRKSLEIVDRYGVSDVRSALSSFSELAAFIEKPQSPVVLKLPIMPMSVLEDEDGGDVNFELFSDPGFGSVALSQWSFRVKAVIPFSEIEVFKVLEQQD